MVRFKDGRGWHGESGRHSLAARGMVGIRTPKIFKQQSLESYEAEKQREKEYLRSKYYGSKWLTKRELKSLERRRRRFARMYKEDAVTGIPRMR